MQIVRYSTLAAAPWKNGGGVTREVARVPVDGHPFLWRVSVAQIDKPGPFSDFAGYRRTMVLLRGDGVSLKFKNGAERSLARVGDLIEFDGALAADCALENGPCVDFNLMTANSIDAVAARVECVASPRRWCAKPGRLVLIFPIDGRVSLKLSAADEIGLGCWDLALLSQHSGACTVCASEAGGAAAGLPRVFVAHVPA